MVLGVLAGDDFGVGLQGGQVAQFGDGGFGQGLDRVAARWQVGVVVVGVAGVEGQGGGGVLGVVVVAVVAGEGEAVGRLLLLLGVWQDGRGRGLSGERGVRAGGLVQEDGRVGSVVGGDREMLREKKEKFRLDADVVVVGRRGGRGRGVDRDANGAHLAQDLNSLGNYTTASIS